MNNSPLDADQFQQLGHDVVDQLASFLKSIDSRPLCKVTTPNNLQEILGRDPLPENGGAADTIISEISEKLIEHSLYNGHPGFMGYITSSALPIGALADFIAATINQNVGGWRLSPMATEIERQTIQWITDFIGYEKNCGGILVSGGNMANFIGFLTAKSVIGGKHLQQKGLHANEKQLVCYASVETHTWIHKASDLFGIGSDGVRWISTNEKREMDVLELERQIKEDLENGFQPFLVVGTAGSVSFGSVDPLQKIAAICKSHDLWFHIDGAYGAPAAASAMAPKELSYLHLADSIAMDPHKWLYSALEVGCTLVKDPQHLRDTFSHNPAYYDFAKQDSEIDFHEYGLQNSRGFRALKVWVGFKFLGRKGFVDLIDKDIILARKLAEKVKIHPQIEFYSNHLSITTFRFIPSKYASNKKGYQQEINEINKEILQRIYHSGKAFVSNAFVDETYLLRACLVNFRTTEADLDLLLALVISYGEELST